MTYVLFNPLSDNKKGKIHAFQLKDILKDRKIEFLDLTALDDTVSFVQSLPEDDEIILAGGDGTLNRFINNIGNLIEADNLSSIKAKLYYYPSGSGNDFKRDVMENEEDENLIPLKKYLFNLPKVTVNDKTSYFINGIGYGIDGYCCEEGDRVRKKSKRTVNYTKIALKGLFYAYKPTNAKVTIDGKVFNYRKVWLAPSMHGRFFGGGMQIAPMQDRFNKENTVTVVVAYGCSNLKILSVFPKIFNGDHVSHKEILDFHTAHEVKVEFDKPTALQIDGETVSNVFSYSVKAFGYY